MKFIETGRTRSDVKRKVLVMVDDEDYELLNQFNWQCGNDKMIRRHGERTLMHRLIMKAPDHLEVDHIDGNRLNNQRSNLRLCTSSQNKCNRGPRSDNKSGYKGVSWHKQNQKWTVRVKTPHGKYLSCGCYHDIREAAMAYNKVAKRLHGEFAYLNKL